MDMRRSRELIIEVLSHKPLLTVEELYACINKSREERKYSIKAIYKELRKLREDGVVVRVQRKHALHLPWILETIAFANTLERNYVTNSVLPDLVPYEKRYTWHFQNLLQMNDFWSHLLLALIQQSKGKILLGWNPHPWFHLVQTEHEQQYIHALGLAKSKLYLVVGGNSFLDCWTKRFWDGNTVEYAFDVGLFMKDRTTYINVIDDYVLTVKLDQRVACDIDRIYQETHSMDEVDLASVISIFRNPTKAVIRLERCPKKARNIKAKFKRYWGVDFS